MNKSQMHRFKGHREGECMEDVRIWSVPHRVWKSQICGFMKVYCLKEFLMELFYKDICDIELKPTCEMVIFEILLFKTSLYIICIITCFKCNSYYIYISLLYILKESEVLLSSNATWILSLFCHLVLVMYLESLKTWRRHNMYRTQYVQQQVYYILKLSRN